MTHSFDLFHPMGYTPEFIAAIDPDETDIVAEWDLRTERAVALLMAKGFTEEGLAEADPTLEDMEFIVVELYTRVLH